MNESPNLVIVIPTKNRRALLERALESVFSQAYKDYRVVVINDGSTDDTQAYLNSLHDSRVKVIHHEKSRAVNAARNAAYRTLKEGEWAVPLDDDDLFLPGAFETIAQAVSVVPANISILQFDTIIKTPKEEYVGGGVFEDGVTHHDLTYGETMTGAYPGAKGRGESRVAFKWSLFPNYLFEESVNGFEGEWWLKVMRDGIGVRYVKTPPIVWIDWEHGGEHLSDTAARRNPGSFAQAHLRILRYHRDFFLAYPGYAVPRTIMGMKLSLRALRPVLFLRFVLLYLRLRLRLALARAKKQHDADGDAKGV